MEHETRDTWTIDRLGYLRCPDCTRQTKAQGLTEAHFPHTAEPCDFCHRQTEGLTAAERLAANSHRP
jgi:hypothetical protein